MGEAGRAPDPRRRQSRPTRASPAGSASAAPRTSTARSPPPRRPSRLIRETSREQRLELLQAIAAEYQKRYAEIAEAITEEMGAPSALAQRAQAAVGIGHLQTAIGVLKDYAFEEQRGATLIKKEPIGVCGFITPWNWPINQIATKVFPALATGCTMVLKPSEIAPFSGYIFAQVLARRRRPGRRVQPGQRRRARTSAPPSPPIPTSTWSPSPARPAPGSRSPRPPPTRSSGSIRSSAASRPSSSSRMPTSARRSPRRCATC